MERSSLPMEKTVGEFVAEDYRVAAVFDRHGIDFCCGGTTALTDICRERGLDCSALLGEIEEAKGRAEDRSQNYGRWELPFLADYIVNTHHSYIRETAGTIAAYARKIAEVHGPRHSELITVAEIFDRVAADLKAHLREEEDILFPAVRRLDAARKGGIVPEEADLELMETTLRNLQRDHEEVGDAIHRIRDLTGNYTIPEDACNTYAVTLRKLKEFEDDLHKHVHLENNILFPKTMPR